MCARLGIRRRPPNISQRPTTSPPAKIFTGACTSRPGFHLDFPKSTKASNIQHRWRISYQQSVPLVTRHGFFSLLGERPFFTLNIFPGKCNFCSRKCYKKKKKKKKKEKSLCRSTKRFFFFSLFRDRILYFSFTLNDAESNNRRERRLFERSKASTL